MFDIEEALCELRMGWNKSKDSGKGVTSIGLVDKAW